jgi:hypothetical protein
VSALPSNKSGQEWRDRVYHPDDVGRNNITGDISRFPRIASQSRDATGKLLVSSPASFTWSTALEFGRRQYTLLRNYSPLHWSIAALSTTIPIIGWITAGWLILQSNIVPIGAILAAFVLHQIRASLRRRISSFLGIGSGTRVALLDHFSAPALVLFHAAIVWSTLLSSSIKWGDRIYELRRDTVMFK